LFACDLPDDTALQVFLVDDGSTDGTADAVRANHPDVEILEGNGNLYWNGGMRLAFAVAMERRFDYYLWLNDDTFLYPKALSTLFAVAAQQERIGAVIAIVVGSTQAKPGGAVNHGGIAKWQRLDSRLVVPQNVATECGTMYGNCVLIPDLIARRLGNLDPAFVHSMGDVDYGLRASKAGFPIFVMPGYAGVCERNPVAGTFNDASLPLGLRIQRLLGPKGLPPGQWATFLWRHFGIAGMLYWLWIYAKLPLTWLRARMKIS